MRDYSYHTVSSIINAFEKSVNTRSKQFENEIGKWYLEKLYHLQEVSFYMIMLKVQAKRKQYVCAEKNDITVSL